MKGALSILFLPLLFMSCSSKPIVIPPPAPTAHHLKTPPLLLPQDADPDMKTAAIVFGQYANSDEFYDFLRKNVQELEGGNESSVEVAIHKFRRCLQESSPIKIEWKKFSKNKGNVIGAWRQTYLAQNPFKKLDVIERSGHWIHEISHACGLTHIENDIRAYPIIKKSWPYQVGINFKEFLSEKAL